MARDEFRNTLSYWDYSRIFNVITKYPELIPDMFRNGINLSLSESQKSIEWIETHIPELDLSVNQINRISYNDYTLSEIFFRIKVWMKEEVVWDWPVIIY